MRTGLIDFATHFVAGIFQLPPDIVASQIPMVAPFPTSKEEVLHRRAVDKLLCERNGVWVQNLGYLLEDDTDVKKVNEEMRLIETSSSEGESCFKPATYGEITLLGGRQLFYHMGMAGAYKNDIGDDKIVFCDMGSGVGKFVMQAYMELPRLHRSIGIELAPQRHQNALKAWEKLQPSAEAIRNGLKDQQDISIVTDAAVQFIEGDFLRADLSGVTHMYVSSLCFTEDMIRELAIKLEHGAPNLQSVATLRAFPPEFQKKGILDRKNYEVVYKTFGMITTSQYAEMTWTENAGGKGCEVHIYTKAPPI